MLITSDALTALELRDCCTALATHIGIPCDVVAMTSHRSNNYGTSDNVSILISVPEHHFFRATTFSEAFTAATTWADTYRVTARNNFIRKLALAIIDLTDQHTRCTKPLLLAGREFSEAQLTPDNIAAACERATEMASPPHPFEVLAA